MKSEIVTRTLRKTMRCDDNGRQLETVTCNNRNTEILEAISCNCLGRKNAPCLCRFLSRFIRFVLGRRTALHKSEQSLILLNCPWPLLSFLS
jgi:hypothetical protein